MAKKKSPGRMPLPRCKAILLCDQVIIDAATGKTTLVGIFDRFFAPKFPYAVGPFAAYLQLVSGIGRYEMTIEIHDMHDNAAIARLAPLSMQFLDRVHKATLIFKAAPLVLPHPGQYDFVVLAGGRQIDRQSFDATLPPKRIPPGGGK
jgi:hypothetical protein